MYLNMDSWLKFLLKAKIVYLQYKGLREVQERKENHKNLPTPKQDMGRLSPNMGSESNFLASPENLNPRCPGNSCLWESNYYELIVNEAPTPKTGHMYNVFEPLVSNW